MATNLQTPILNNRTRSINFFNGRLLTGEDLTAEQQANRAARNLLGHAIGAGVVHGLEVSESVKLSSPQAPVLTVTKGLAINHRGAPLPLAADTDIALVRPANTSGGAAAVFQDCQPVQSGVYIAGAGVYLLTIGPASAPEGLAEVSGISTAAASCNSNYNAYGVQFRLVQLNLNQAQLADTDHLRNNVAYLFFSPTDWAAIAADPLGVHPPTHGLLDQLLAAQAITDCEVPLAVLYWTATGGLNFIDMWPVRRTLTAAGNDWLGLYSERRIVKTEAMVRQFQDQAQWIVDNEDNLQSLAADSIFRFLPPAGIVPIAGQGSLSGFDPLTFFGAHASQDIATTDGDLLNQIFHEALFCEPIDLASVGKIQLYLIWENLQAVTHQQSTQLALVFATAALRYRGIARFGFAKWSLSRFAPRVI